MNYTTLLEEVKHYALHFFKSHEDPQFIYHNQVHTESVVKAATLLAAHYQLDDRDVFIVLTAAWFHDMGYYTGPAQGHEQNASDMAARFLRDKGVDELSIGEVQQCIMATCMNGQVPQGLKAQIVSDADLFHWGTDEFAERNKLMRKEAETRLDKKIPKEEWQKGTIKLLESHQFRTDFARQLLEGKKQENLQKLKNKFEDAPVEVKKVDQPEGAKQKKGANARPERGIETMFRISSGNHQRLSDMADNKAHIMITTTSIILSVLLSVLLRKLEDNPHLVIPTFLLLIVCVTTMVFSILATRPTLPNGTFNQKDIDDKKVNLLFFGNFYRMSYEEYSGAMNEMMNDRDFLYGSLTRDVYSQGIVLSRKYRLLRIAYNVFMFGIVVSVLAFAVATIIFGH